MKSIIAALALILATLGAQAQTIVTMGPGTAPGGAIPCVAFGCQNIPNSAGLPLSIGVDLAGYGQNVAVLFNGATWSGTYVVPVVVSGTIAIRRYDTTLTNSADGTVARLQMTVYVRSDRCNVRVAHGCGYYRIQPDPAPTITFN
jgi:hypothetical protein